MMSRLNSSLKNIGEALSHVNNIILKRVTTATAAMSHQKAHLASHADHHHHHHLHQMIKHSQYQYGFVEFANEMNIMRDFIFYSNVFNRNESCEHRSLSTLNVPIVDLATVEVYLNPSDETGLRFGRVLANMENSSELVQSPGGVGEKSMKRLAFC